MEGRKEGIYLIFEEPLKHAISSIFFKGNIVVRPYFWSIPFCTWLRIIHSVSQSKHLEPAIVNIKHSSNIWNRLGRLLCFVVARQIAVRIGRLNRCGVLWQVHGNNFIITRKLSTKILFLNLDHVNFRIYLIIVGPHWYQWDISDVGYPTEIELIDSLIVHCYSLSVCLSSSYPTFSLLFVSFVSSYAFGLPHVFFWNLWQK